MTTKELLYIQDALEHEKIFKQKCCETANKLSDPQLKQFVQQLETRHTEIFNKIYQTL